MSELRCTRTVDIGAYLLGGLTQDEAVALRHHADGCEACSLALRELQPLTDQLRSSDLRQFAGMTVDQPPADLRDRILQQASAESARVPHARRRWATAAAAATIFAVGSGAGWSARLVAAPTAPTTSRAVYWGTGQETNLQKVYFAHAEAGPRAWASISSGPAGTYAALYTKGLQANTTYRWWFETLEGTRVPLGSFVFPENQTDWVVCPGGTSVERIKLAAIGATDPDGIDVLRAALPNAARPS
jgi:hypothetical protein